MSKKKLLKFDLSTIKTLPIGLFKIILVNLQSLQTSTLKWQINPSLKMEVKLKFSNLCVKNSNQNYKKNN